MSLSKDQRAKYVPIIDGLLKASNLEEVSANAIRKSLQGAVDEDLREYKGELKSLIHERYDKVRQEVQPQPSPDEPSPKPESPVANGVSSASVATPDDEPEERPKKKQKTSKGESDAALAARLQAEENGRTRPTRGGATRKKAAPVKKSPKKKKSATKVDSDDDSAAEGEGSDDKPKRKGGGAFNAPMQLSEPLAALLGEQRLSRPQTVKHLWNHIKANNLQHENDKRQIRCDNQMRAIFNQDNIHMFSMNKTLSKHLYPLPEGEVNQANGELSS